MSVIINMACGLANRMFQYAFYLYLQKKGYDAYVDYFTRADLVHENVDWLRIFPEATFREATARAIRKMGGGHDCFSRLRRKLLPMTTKVLETSGAFEIILPPKNRDSYLLGAFQSAKMVESVDAEVRRIFTFPEFESGKNQYIQTRLAQENSVGLHIRKGKDYQERIWYKNTCGVEYYRKAVDLMREKVDSPSFYVFTDNPAWVKENLSWLEYKLVDGNPGSGWGSHCDMQLMSLCKHNIISNSSYSWWGAYLNNTLNKIVVCPRIWFNPESTKDFSSNPLLAEGWISL